MKQYSWDKYFNELVSKYKYTFTLSELKEQFHLSEKSLLRGLYRYKKNKKIAKEYDNISSLQRLGYIL